MHTQARWTRGLGPIAGLLAVVVVLAPGRARAHCDGLDGPVVTAARQALEKKDVSAALVWVQEKDEHAIREAFDRTLAVRRLGEPARELADLYFFETLVRLHRAGEGAPYTGLAPAGRDLGPAIPAADRALATGDLEPLARLLKDAADEGLRRRFAEAMAAKAVPAGNVPAGRAYVARYVPFLHYVERLYESATTDVKGHEAEAGTAEAHAH